MPFEIGVVYKKGKQLYLAVSDSTLLGRRNGGVAVIRPTSDYKVARLTSVEVLCEAWGIDLDTLDTLSYRHLPPPPRETLKSRPRGEKRTIEEEGHYWQRKRTGRFRRPVL